jgi:hypothetical protein
MYESTIIATFGDGNSSTDAQCKERFVDFGAGRPTAQWDMIKGLLFDSLWIAMTKAFGFSASKEELKVIQ